MTKLDELMAQHLESIKRLSQEEVDVAKKIHDESLPWDKLVECCTWLRNHSDASAEFVRAREALNAHLEDERGKKQGN
jgi:hypothetical protein